MNNNVVYDLIGKNYEYHSVEAKDNTKGHGSNLSVKIVVPSYCQANCPFCFNQLTKGTQHHDIITFLDNLDKSLALITNNVTERGITLDITGNEPTFNIFLFKKFMDELKKYRHKVTRIILSTNGFRLNDCIPYMYSIVDIVNISTHHYDYNKRKKIFNTTSIPNDEELKEIIRNLKDHKIKVTSVCVLYEDVKDFTTFYTKYTSWAKSLGFKDVRMRSNFRENDKFIDDYLAIDFPIQSTNSLSGLTTKIITDEKDHFETRILKGVPDLTDYVLGAELVIDDDGKCYIDYNKRYPVDENTIEYFNRFYIIDNKPKVKTRKRTP